MDDGEVSPGQNCLDKQYVAEAFDCIIKSIENKDHGDFNHLAALELAGALQVLREARDQILNEGVIVKTAKTDKDGKVVGWEYIPHPAWPHYMKMLSDLGLTFSDFNMTPKAISKAEKGASEEEMETAASLMSRVVKRLGRPGGGNDED